MEETTRGVNTLDLNETITLEPEEEKETPAPSPGDEETNEADPGEEAEEPASEPTEPGLEEQKTEEKPEPRPVEGETPRDRAQRLEIERLRQKVRDLTKKSILSGEPAPAPEPKKSAKYDELLVKYNPEELQNFEEIFAGLADKHGYVKKDELSNENYQQSAEHVLEEFLDKHPEYLPENDKDNVLWGMFQEEYKLYKKPASPKDFKKIFERIHRDIVPTRTLDAGSAAAKQAKVQTASHGGTTVTNSPSPKRGSPLDPSLKSHLRGFTDEELSELFG